MEKQFQLMRKESKDNEWKRTAKGNMDYILTILQLNLENSELQQFEWKVSSVS